MTTTDWIQAAAMIILVAVTAFYAWRTHVIAKATKQQADASVRPIVTLVYPYQMDHNLSNYAENVRREYTNLRDWFINIGYANVGMGPALNVAVSIKYLGKELNELRILALEVTGKEMKTHGVCKKLLHDETIKWDALIIKAYYEDVSDTDKAWVTCLRFDKQENPYLKILPAKRRKVTKTER